MKRMILFLAFLGLTSVGFAQFRCGQTLVDARDGQTYSTLWVGGRCWMGQNLNYGTMVVAGDITTQQTDNGIPEKFCYDNKPENCLQYGGLYTWNEIMQYTSGQEVQGLCPDGWHVPALADFDQLAATFPGDCVGLALQEGGTSGLNLLACGYSFYCSPMWRFNGLKEIGTIRTANESVLDEWNSVVKYYYPGDPGFYTADHYKKENSYGVRCISNDQPTQGSTDSPLPANSFWVSVDPNTHLVTLTMTAIRFNQALPYRVIDAMGRQTGTGTLPAGSSQIGPLGTGTFYLVIYHPDASREVHPLVLF